MGNFEIVEFAYQKCKNFERLSFLYLGDVRERVKILQEVGQLPLAYITAKSHGMEEEAESIAQALTEQEMAVPEYPQKGGTLMLPPTPILREENWPLLQITKSQFDGINTDNLISSGNDTGMMDLEADHDEDGGAWGGDDLDLAMPGAEGEFDLVDEEEDMVGDLDEDGGWEMEDLDLPEDVGGAA